MFQNDLLFSLLLSLLNTVSYYLITNHNQKKELKDQKNEYLMMFGITFIISFLLKTGLEKINISEGKSDISTISHSSRPPF